LIEDDPFHAQVIGQELRNAFGRGIQIHVVSTEKQFRQDYVQGWDVAVLDQMMAWTTEDDPEPYLEAPDAGPLRAGSRCYNLLRTTETTKKVPVVFFTNLDQDTVPEEARDVYVRKSTDFKPLIATIRSVLPQA
jgi:CheY-like chemotaxis protein